MALLSASLSASCSFRRQRFLPKERCDLFPAQGRRFSDSSHGIHLLRSGQEDPWTYAWVGFDGKNCKQTLRQTVFFHSFVFLNSVPEKTAQICDAMAFLLQSFQNSHGNQLQLTGSLLLLLSHMRNTVDGKREEFTHRYFQKAQEYIENNYSYDIKISDIARHVGIDRTYLYRIFMEEEQLSPKQYLMQHRIRIATQMLSSASYTITEIAFSCGFKDSPSFVNHFKNRWESHLANFARTF